MSARKPKIETRADVAGVKLKGLSGRTHRAITKIELLLQALSVEWEEYESGFAWEIDKIYQDVGHLRSVHLAQSLEHLAQPWDAE